MEKEYQISKEESYQMGCELFLSKSKKIKWCLEHLKYLAVLGAVVWALIAPAKSTSNGEYSLIASIIMALLVQIPVCSVILYFIFKAVLNLPLKAIKVEMEKHPETHWGTRLFSVSKKGLTLKTQDTEFTVAPERIKTVSETESMISLSDGETTLFALPKPVFSKLEIQEALEQIKAEPAGIFNGGAGPRRE